MKSEFQDRIDDYLLDRMSDEERKSFESDAAEDAELKEQLQFTETVLQATMSRNEKLAAMQQWKDDYVWEGDMVAATSASECRPTGSGYDYCPAPSTEETRSIPRSSGRRILYWVSGIAAVFVVGFFIFRGGNSSSINDDLDLQVVEYSCDDGAIRAGTDNEDIRLLLKQKKYKDALRLTKEKYSSIREDSLQIVQDREMDEERKAYDMQIVKDKQDELKWLKAHALLGLNQQETALCILDELRNEEGYYQMAADSLYNHVKK